MKITVKSRFLLATSAVLAIAKLTLFGGMSWWFVTFPLWALPVIAVLLWLFIGCVMLLGMVLAFALAFLDVATKNRDDLDVPQGPKKSWDDRVEEMRKQREERNK